MDSIAQKLTAEAGTYDFFVLLTSGNQAMVLPVRDDVDKAWLGDLFYRIWSSIAEPDDWISDKLYEVTYPGRNNNI